MGEEKLPDNNPNKKFVGLRNFFNQIWEEIAPLVTEFFSYILIILVVALVTRITEPFLPDDIKEILNFIKYGLVIAVVGILSLRTIILVLIKSAGFLRKEWKKIFASDIEKKSLESKEEISELETLKEERYNKGLNSARLEPIDHSSSEEQPIEALRRKNND